MSADAERPPGEFPKVMSAERAAERYMRGIINGQLAEVLRLVQDHARQLARISDNLDHLHRDVTALREVQSIPRPECYPDIERRQAARRRRKSPRPEEPPTSTPP